MTLVARVEMTIASRRTHLSRFILRFSLRGIMGGAYSVSRQIELIDLKYSAEAARPITTVRLRRANIFVDRERVRILLWRGRKLRTTAAHLGCPRVLCTRFSVPKP